MSQKYNSKELNEKERIDFIIKRVELIKEIKESLSTDDIEEILKRVEKGKLHGYTL